MRVLLSTIGSRRDVQPLVALAVQLMASGQAVRLCAPPDFRAWIEGSRFPFVPLGPDTLAAALSHALRPDVAVRARSIADAVLTHGAQTAAQRLITADSQSPC